MITRSDPKLWAASLLKKTNFSITFCIYFDMRIYILLYLVLFNSCLTNDALETSAIADGNLYKLRQLSYGVGEEEVFLKMGSPARVESVAIKGDQYDLWFYITKRTALDQGYLMHNNLTPLIFKNGLLIGMGYHLYDRIIDQAASQTQENQTSSADEPKTEADSESYIDEEGQRMLREAEEEEFNEY